MKNWRNIIIILLVILMQISIIPLLRFHNFVPNLPLAFLFVYLIKKDDFTALWWVTLGGLLLGLFSYQFFGYYFFQFLLVFLAYRTIIRPLLHDPQFLVIIIILFVFSFLISMIEIVIFKQNYSTIIYYGVIYQTIIEFCVYFAISKLFKNSYQIKFNQL